MIGKSPKKAAKAVKPKRKAPAAGVAYPKGDVTFVRIPKPPRSAMNKKRPISDLIKAQLRHIQHAESARLPKEERSGVKIQDIRTEAQAASYIAAITKLLHPQGFKKSKKRQSS
jgi:hypothetical protein